MGIFTSGSSKPVWLLCVKTVQGDGFVCTEGQKYEMVLDLSSMYIVKCANGAEGVVPKDAFVMAPA